MKWMSDWLVANDLKNITLFCQDWGGLIGLRLVAAFPERFARVVAGNTFLPAGSGANPAFEAWRTFSQTVPVFPTGNILNGGTVRDLSQAEMDAYEAPYPDESYKAGARQFPALVPVAPDMPSVKENLEAWKVLESFDKPFLTAFSDQDPITRGADKRLQERIPGCRRPKAHDHRRRRPLPAGRQARRARRRDRCLHQGNSVSARAEKTAEPMEVDGRRQRSDASRRKIALAMLDLLREGEADPSADLVAERAGVGRRTVFRLFSDMEGVFREMHAIMASRLTPEFARRIRWRRHGARVWTN